MPNSLRDPLSLVTACNLGEGFRIVWCVFLYSCLVAKSAERLQRSNIPSQAHRLQLGIYLTRTNAPSTENISENIRITLKTIHNN